MIKIYEFEEYRNDVNNNERKAITEDLNNEQIETIIIKTVGKNLIFSDLEILQNMTADLPVEILVNTHEFTLIKPTERGEFGAIFFTEKTITDFI